jgi:AraC-like DNA-binding protein
VGFTDSAHFSRAFKKQFEQSPKDFDGPMAGRWRGFKVMRSLWDAGCRRKATPMGDQATAR